MRAGPIFIFRAGGGIFLGTGSETGIVEGGVLPYQPWALEEVKRRRDNVELDPTGHCHYEGIPHALYFRL